jgi:hypothetical protein
MLSLRDLRLMGCRSCRGKMAARVEPEHDQFWRRTRRALA